MATVPVGHVVEIPHDAVTKEEFLSLMGGDNPSQRTLDLLRSAPTRDLVSQSIGLVDQALADLLAAFLVDASRDRLLGRGRGFADFEIRIELAFGVGLIGDEERQQLHRLRQIRNPFAHDPNLFELEHDEKVLGRCYDLRFPSGAPKFSLRERVAFAANVCVMQLRDRVQFAATQKRNVYTRPSPQGDWVIVNLDEPKA